MPQVARRNHTRSVRRFYWMLFIIPLALGIVSSSSAERGTKSSAVQQTYPPNVVGRWEDSFTTAPLVHASLLPNNKVMHWTQHNFVPPTHPTYTRLWGCVINSSTGLCNPDFDGNNREDIWYYNSDLFCSGHSLLPDGRVWITGGTLFNLADDGSPVTTFYNPATNVFAAGPTMAKGRWYPTNVPLGEQNKWALVASGTYCPARTPGGNQDERNCPVEYDFNDTPEILQDNGQLHQLTGAGDITLPRYPWLFYASNGKVFYAGPEEQALWLNIQGNGDWEAADPDLVSSTFRDSGSAVMYDKDKVLISGGGGGSLRPTNTAEIIDLSNEQTADWEYTGSMNYSRKHHNLTLLADGKVLATGGTMGRGFNNSCMYYAANEAEIWNPNTGTWSVMSRALRRRIYHSTALLLPDARVLVGGSTAWVATTGCPPVENEYRTEIFTPPYLFDANGNLATRPAISSAPDSINYAQSFTVNMTNVANISAVNLVRLSSVTHSVNMNQRINRLSFTSSGSALTVTAPVNGLVSPPGHYMLFLINGAGVPSVAKIVRVTY